MLRVSSCRFFFSFWKFLARAGLASSRFRRCFFLSNIFFFGFGPVSLLSSRCFPLRRYCSRETFFNCRPPAAAPPPTSSSPFAAIRGQRKKQKEKPGKEENIKQLGKMTTDEESPGGWPWGWGRWGWWASFLLAWAGGKRGGVYRSIYFLSFIFFGHLSLSLSLFLFWAPSRTRYRKEEKTEETNREREREREREKGKRRKWQPKLVVFNFDLVTRVAPPGGHRFPTWTVTSFPSSFCPSSFSSSSCNPRSSLYLVLPSFFLTAYFGKLTIARDALFCWGVQLDFSLILPSFLFTGMYGGEKREMSSIE